MDSRMVAAITAAPRAAPRKSSFDSQPSQNGASSSGTIHRVNSGQAVGLDEEAARMEDDGETVESVQSKLAIERKVQLGAEKMLEVIEQRTGGDPSEQERMTATIIDQLEAANERIKVLEGKLERLTGGTSSTPSRSRRRPQPRLNGYGSATSLGAGLSASAGSASYLSAAGTRPRPSRANSSYRTPEKEREFEFGMSQSGYLTPSKASVGASPAIGSTGGGKHRSRSSSFGPMAGEDGDMAHRSPWSRSPSGISSPDDLDNENTAVLLSAVGSTLRKLRDLLRGARGKGKEVERGDEAWDTLIRLADMLKKNPGLQRLVSTEELLSCVLPYLSDGSNTHRRAAAYRCLRHFFDRQSWRKMLQSGLEWLIIRTFTRDNKCSHEREQALILLRTVVSCPPPIPQRHRHQSSPGRSRSMHSRQHSGQIDGGHLAVIMEYRIPLTDGLVRAIVSAAENPDDPLRPVCAETLVEIGLTDFPRLIHSGAFRTILLAYKDGPHELGPAMTGLLLFLTNQPSTRHLLIPGSDLETVLVGLTEAYGSTPANKRARFAELLQYSVRNVSMLLSSWPGLLYLCMDNYRAIRALISSLHVPIPEQRDALLDLFFSCLRIKTPAFLNAFIEGKRLTVYNRTQEATAQQLHDAIDDDDDSRNLNLVDHFVSLLLAIFVEADLMGALVAVVEQSEPALSRKATLLLGEILQLSNRILPLPYAAKLQALPRFFGGATEFTDSQERHFALTALSSIDSLNRNQSRIKRQLITRERAGSTTQDPLRSVQTFKLQAGLAMEDRQFQQLIVDSNVLLGRDHTKWNYDIILELCEGPLLNPKRMDEAIKATKFIRRLMGFYHPTANRFSSIKRTRPNHKWVKLGCSLLTTILMSPEGIKFLGEDKLLKELADCFVDIEKHPNSSHAVFSADRLENSLSYGYFEMIGVLSKHREGLKLLEKFKFFNTFYHLSEQRNRDAILRFLIECFDYSEDSHPRVVLSKALTSSVLETRLFATHHLGRIMHEFPALQDWSLQLMVTQLYDVAMEVCDVAVMYVEEAVTGTASLEKVVQMRPTLEHLGDVGHPLLMRFVSTSVGFRYLFHAGIIDRELESWITERNLLYVIEAETFVSKTLRPFTSNDVEDYWQYDSMAPTHFLGELTKTREGCMFLKERGLVAEYCEFVRNHGMEAAEEGVLMNVKTALWALGNIGSTEGGLPFLEDEEIVEVIVEIAEQSPVLTIRGTCFFVIGLLSTSRQGAELLEELGWISTRTPIGRTTGLCLPNDISRFVHLEKWSRPPRLTDGPHMPTLTGLEGEIITWIANLSNYVLAAGAMNNLKRTRTRHPRYFSSITLFHRALRMISTNHYQAPVRRFILDLFDIPLESETLLQLCHLEAAIHVPPARHGPPSTSPEAYPYPQGLEHVRRRSASYPGPKPEPGDVPPVPNPATSAVQKHRVRGLTLSEMRPAGAPSGGVPRDRMAAFGVLD